MNAFQSFSEVEYVDEGVGKLPGLSSEPQST